MLKSSLTYLSLLLLLLIMAACSSVRHVPDGSLLLNKVSIDINDSTHTLDPEEMLLYVRQQPNHKLLWSVKFQLGIYNMSGKDTTKWLNRWVRSLGEAPVIYDAKQTEASVAQLQRAMTNMGFLKARAEADTISKPGSKKMDVIYRLYPGSPHIIQNVDYQIADTAIAGIVNRGLRRTLIETGANLDLNVLESERERITNSLRNRGYYAFTKDLITFSADTTEGSNAVDLSVIIQTPQQTQAVNQLPQDSTYIVRDVYVVMNYDPATMPTPQYYAASDTVSIDHVHIISNGKPYLRPKTITDNIRIRPGELYSARDVTRTYQALGRLEILNFAGIRMVPAGESDGIGFLDAYVLLTPGKPQSITLELEGTNSEGDLGVAVAAGYSHKISARARRPSRRDCAVPTKASQATLRGCCITDIWSIRSRPPCNFPNSRRLSSLRTPSAT